jgi:hypothetical protein
MAAKVLGPAMALEKEEASELAKGIADVAQHYNAAVDPKTLAWLNLGMILFAIYGTRIGLIVMLAKQNKRKPATVLTPSQVEAQLQRMRQEKENAGIPDPYMGENQNPTGEVPVFDPSQLTPLN